MSLMRRKRLERLERLRRAPKIPYFETFDLCMALWAAFDADKAAVKAGREFSRLPEPGVAAG